MPKETPKDPPPWTPPLADQAPPQLTALLYLLMKDHVPIGTMERLSSQAIQGQARELPNPHLRAIAEQHARALAHTD